MEDLQSALQSILSDPEQMRRVAAMAESLGLKPPSAAPRTDSSAPPFPGHSERSEESASPSSSRHPEAGEASASPAPQGTATSSGLLNGLDLPKLMTQLSAMNGTEDKVLGALRPSLSREGQGKTDRALRAAKLSRLVGQFLSRRRNADV